MKKISVALIFPFVFLFAFSSPVFSTENSGCRRWHSCPSTHGSYVCGDLGYCGQCPDNPYCLQGQARSKGLPPASAPQSEPVSSLPVQWIKVKKVVDGDTLVLKDKRKIRLIGIDTPEKFESVKLYRDAERSHLSRKSIQSLGKRSSEIAKKLVDGRTVRLEYGHALKDSHDRTLAYVYFKMRDGELHKIVGGISADGAEEKEFMLNRVLVESGYATIYPRFPFKYQEEFTEVEHSAREAQRGLWKEGMGLLELTPGEKAAPENEVPPF